MNFTYWLRRMFSSRGQGSRAVRRGKSRQVLRRRCMPSLERLEDRLAPAILMVTNTNENGTGSLSAAIDNSGFHINGGTGNDTIQFSSALDGKTIVVSQEGNVAGSGLFIPSFQFRTNLTIDGQTGLTKGITIAGTTGSRIFENGANLTLIGLTLEDGDAQGFAGGNASGGGAGGGSAGLGGAIFNQGTLTIEKCTLTGNTAQGGAGGSFHYLVGEYGGSGGAGLNASGQSAPGNNGGAGGGTYGGSGGTSTSPGGGVGAFGGGGGGAGGHGNAVAIGGFGGGNGNGAKFYCRKYGIYVGDAGGGEAGMGGAIFNEGGSVVITNSTFTGNAAIGDSGGTGFSSTTSGTAGEGLGGAVFNHNGSLKVINSTFSGNTAASSGRGIFNLGDSVSSTYGVSTATATITNTIIGQSDTAGVDFVGKTLGSGTNDTSGSNNLIGDGGTGLGSIVNGTNGNQVGTSSNPINPLLSSLGSYGGLTQTMALLPGNPAIDNGSNSLAVDANGNPLTTDQRGLNRKVNGTVDIGAFESSGFTIAATSGGGQTAGTSNNFTNPLVATVTANNPSEPVAGGKVTFTAPASGASATLSPNPATISATGTAGVNATADGTIGTYTVAAKTAGADSPATFSLTNAVSTTDGLILAINNANKAGGSTTITLASGAPFDFTTANNSTNGTNALPVITANITLVGNGDTIQRDSSSSTPAFRLFDVASGGSLTLDGVTLSGGFVSTSDGAIYNSGTVNVNGSTLSGNSSSFGGGIYNKGSLTISGSTLEGNTAAYYGGTSNNYGGGIVNWTAASLTLSDSTLSGNSASGVGGGIWIDGGTVKVSGSTLSANSAGSAGGGIINHGGLTIVDSTLATNVAGTVGGGIGNGGSLSVSNSTLYGNTASTDGGGIFNTKSSASAAGAVAISNGTLYGNSAASGGGIYVASGAVTLHNTLVAGNSDADVSGRLNSASTYSLIGDGSGGLAFGTNTSHNIKGEPNLALLGSYGGSTQTVALLPGSLGIGAGDPSQSGSTD